MHLVLGGTQFWVAIKMPSLQQSQNLHMTVSRDNTKCTKTLKKYLTTQQQQQEVLLKSQTFNGVSQRQGYFLGRAGPWKSGPTEPRQDSFLAFRENIMEQDKIR